VISAAVPESFGTTVIADTGSGDSGCMANTAKLVCSVALSPLPSDARTNTKKWNPSSSHESNTGWGAVPASRPRSARNSGERFSGVRNVGSAQGRSYATAKSAAMASCETAGPAVVGSPQRRRRGAGWGVISAISRQRLVAPGTGSAPGQRL
jgi:hypothetical protein